jgi:hypothetical protein
LTDNVSEYPGLDVFFDGAVILGNHHDMGSGFAPTVWQDYDAGICFFSPLRHRVPDTHMVYDCSSEDQDSGWCRYGWPSVEYQPDGWDAIFHVFGRQMKPLDDTAAARITYYRYYWQFGDTLPPQPRPAYWNYPPTTIDTTIGLSQTVTASRASDKLALVWTANLPETPGEGESFNRFLKDHNDLYYMISYNTGNSWGEKFNITKSDSSKDGTRAYVDLSALITTDDNLHVVWTARDYAADPDTFPHYYGCMLLHWDELSDSITVVKDANWDLPEESPCHGGRWRELSIVNPQISECNGKLYVLFTQYNDIYRGIYDDCHEDAFSEGIAEGTANGDLFLTLSVDGGLNWSIACNLTNTYTPHCTDDCVSESYASMSRFGMESSGDNFDGVPVIDPTGEYTGDYYLDVQYIEDKSSGAIIHGYGSWTVNPVRWFRIPCIDSIPDSDTDGVADFHDNCPGLTDPDQGDPDQDGHGNPCDNCPDVYNPDQADENDNGYGDACEPRFCGDANNDGNVDILDIAYLITYLYGGGPAPDPLEIADVNNDGSVNILDISYLIAFLYQSGPEPNCP